MDEEEAPRPEPGKVKTNGGEVKTKGSLNSSSQRIASGSIQETSSIDSTEGLPNVCCQDSVNCYVSPILSFSDRVLNILAILSLFYHCLRSV